MTVYVVIREIQNDYGYVDVEIAGIFKEERSATECLDAERAKAIAEGVRVEGEDDVDEGEWQMFFGVEEHLVN